MYNLELLNNVFHEFFDQELSVFVIAGKVIAILLFMLTIGKKAFKSFSMHGFAIGKSKEGLSPYDIIRGLMIIVLIVFITQILSAVDNILVQIESITTGRYASELTPMEVWRVPMEEVDGDMGVFDWIAKYLGDLVSMLNPISWVTAILYFVAWITDIILFTIFIAKRFFIMGMIKILAPIIIGLSMLDEYRNLSYNLGKVYLRNFLVIIPYILVFVFAGKIHDALVNAGTLDALPFVGRNTVRTVALVAAVAIKFMLLKKSSEIMKQLIT